MFHRKPATHPTIAPTPATTIATKIAPTAAMAVLVGTLVPIGGVLIGGCAGDGTSSNPLQGALQGIRNPFQGPTEADFFALAREQCSGYSVGGQSLGTLLDGDLHDLTAKLYRGELSNDEYVNMLMQQHPSDDANIPAAGCVINQVTACLSGRCQPAASAAPELKQAEAEVAAVQTEAASQLPASDRGAVDEMTGSADPPTSADLGSEP